MFNKIATAQELLRRLQEKRAGLVAPLLAGATILGGAHLVHQGLQKGREYKAGFQPGMQPGVPG